MGVVRKIWYSVSHLFFPGLGVIYIVIGIIEVATARDDLWSYSNILAGVLIIATYYSSFRCLKCNQRIKFLWVWGSLSNKKYSCNNCQTSYELPRYAQIISTVLTIGVLISTTLGLFLYPYLMNVTILQIALMFLLFYVVGYTKSLQPDY